MTSHDQLLWLAVIGSVLAAYALPIAINRVTRTQLRPFAYPAGIAAVCALLWWALPADSSASDVLRWVAVGFAVQAIVNIALYRALGGRSVPGSGPGRAQR